MTRKSDTIINSISSKTRKALISAYNAEVPVTAPQQEQQQEQQQQQQQQQEHKYFTIKECETIAAQEFDAKAATFPGSWEATASPADRDAAIANSRAHMFAETFQYVAKIDNPQLAHAMCFSGAGLSADVASYAGGENAFDLAHVAMNTGFGLTDMLNGTQPHRRCKVDKFSVTYIEDGFELTEGLSIPYGLVDGDGESNWKCAFTALIVNTFSTVLNDYVCSNAKPSFVNAACNLVDVEYLGSGYVSARNVMDCYYIPVSKICYALADQMMGYAVLRPGVTA